MNKTLLPFFSVVRVSGDDRAAFLHNQLSNDILHLDTAHACYATYNTAQGRVIANMLVIPHQSDICLMMAADLCEKVLTRLRMFVLRSKVVLTIDQNTAVAGELPTTTETFKLPETPPLQLPLEWDASHNTAYITLAHGGVLLQGKPAQLPAYNRLSENTWQKHEITCGFPHISLATSESCVAQMLNQHLLGGIHFKKGCYPGQEIIARAQYRGQVKRGLATYKADAILAPGIKIFDEAGTEAGIVINTVAESSGSLNLCVLKHEFANQAMWAGDKRLTAEKVFFQKREET